MRELAGRELGGRYRLVRQIGLGTTSTVWEATDLVLQRTVAVRVIAEDLQSDARFIEQFRLEAMAAARLSGPGIVAIYDTIREPDLDAVVLEYLTGMALSDFLRKYAPLGPHDAVDLGCQVLTALANAHEAGVIHARISPETIILCDDRRVKITDTGFLTAAAFRAGPYTAPEIAAGDHGDPRSDVFSVGVVLYECLTGHLPYPDGAADNASPARLSAAGVRVPEALERALAKPIAFRPQDRFQSAEEFIAALRSVDLDRDPPTPVAEKGGPPPPDVYERRKGPALVTAAVAALVVLAGIALVATSSGREAVRDLAEGVGLVGSDNSSDGADETAVDAPPQQAQVEAPTPSAEPAIAADVISPVGVAAFDPPPGSGSEHDNLTTLAIDGDAATVWHSEGYATRAFGGLKDGVGLVVETDETMPITTVDVLSPTQGWSVEIYAADEPAQDLAGWGDPLAGASGVAGNAQFDLGEVNAGAVLVWITDLGSGPAPFRIDVAEVTLHASRGG